jgi:type VI protein secretion system component VasK
MRKAAPGQQGGTLASPRVYLACVWVVSALFVLYDGIVHRSSVALSLAAALVPPLIVFIWWTVDRAALERRIKRLEARSEIGDERRIVAHDDLNKVSHRLHEIETRVSQVEDDEAGAM